MGYRVGCERRHRFPGLVSITKNGVSLVNGVHYTYSYDASVNTMTLTPVGTSFGNGTYVINVASSMEDLTGNVMPSTTINLTVNAGSTLNTVSFRNGENGYTGAKDTYLHEDDPATNHGSDAKVISDGDDDLGTAETPVQRVQGMIRFDAMFNTPSGSRGGGPIPDGSTITNATLAVKTGPTAGDESPSGNFFTLHRMIATWAETSTWDSMIGGVSLDDIEASMAASALVNGPAVLGGLISFDLTADVQLWSNNNTLSLRGWVVNRRSAPTVGSSNQATPALFRIARS